MIVEYFIVEEIVDFEETEDTKISMFTIETIAEIDDANHVKVNDLFVEAVIPSFGGRTV